MFLTLYLILFLFAMLKIIYVLFVFVFGTFSQTPFVKQLLYDDLS